MADKKAEIPTGIMDKKKAPNRLIVDEALNDENSTVALSEAKMEELSIFRGDTFLIKGKKGKETVAIVLGNAETEDAKIRTNKVMRKNLRVRLGDVVTITACDDAPYLKQVHILPLDDTMEGISGNLFET
jgi:transitional endoplasmic reticulum ATPase